jgi:hypothetical protein
MKGAGGKLCNVACFSEIIAGYSEDSIIII